MKSWYYCRAQAACQLRKGSDGWGQARTAAAGTTIGVNSDLFMGEIQNTELQLSLAR